MRFEIPQFIEVEDKIFGPFTWKQFVYLIGGAGATFILFTILPFFLFLIFAAPIVALAAGLAFYPVNDRPLSYFVESVVRYFTNSRLYFWKRRDRAPVPHSGDTQIPTYTPPSSGNRISSLSRKLELRALEGNLTESQKREREKITQT